MLEERLAEDVKAGSSGRLLELVRALERIAENQQTFESSLVDGNWDLVYRCGDWTRTLSGILCCPAL
jgi:hypothetical protein